MIELWQDQVNKDRIAAATEKDNINDKVSILLEIIERNLDTILDNKLFEINTYPCILEVKYKFDYIPESRGVWFDPKLPKRIDKIL